MESQASAHEQLATLDAHREELRDQARYPLWYCAVWGLAVSWWGLIAVIPDDERLWFGLGQWLLFAPLFVSRARRKVKVPRPPWTWPTRRESLLLVPWFIAYTGVFYLGVRNDMPWLVTASAAVTAVLLTIVFYRDQQVVFRDER